MSLVVFTHLHPARSRMPVAGHFERLAQTARHIGLREVVLPYRNDDYDAILERLPVFDRAVGLYNGGVLAEQMMAALAQAAAAKGITMINSAVVNARLMRFERFYPLLEDLTARSVVLRDPADVVTVGERIGFPVFVKGSIISEKEHGWAACVVGSSDDLATRLRGAQGQVLVAREILDLRRDGSTHRDFPVSREYRVYLHGQRALGLGYYWQGDDPFGPPTDADMAAMLHLAHQARRRLEALLIAVDVAQLSDGRWVIIEVGDPQHTGIAHMSQVQFFNALQDSIADSG